MTPEELERMVAEQRAKTASSPERQARLAHDLDYHLRKAPARLRNAERYLGGSAVMADLEYVRNKAREFRRNARNITMIEQARYDAIQAVLADLAARLGSITNDTNSALVEKILVILNEGLDGLVKPVTPLTEVPSGLDFDAMFADLLGGGS